MYAAVCILKVEGIIRILYYIYLSVESLNFLVCVLYANMYYSSTLISMLIVGDFAHEQ